MNRLLGYSLMGLGLLGFFFFLNYNGTAIPLKGLWFVLTILAIMAGGYFLAQYKLQKSNDEGNSSNSRRLAEIEQLKRIGERIRVTLDNAEVKSRSYQQDAIGGGILSQTEILDALHNSNRNYKTQQVQQTYIVFSKQYGGKSYKFVSHATMQDADALKRYIDRQNGIDLYIDAQNPSNYYFDLPYV